MESREVLISPAQVPHPGLPPYSSASPPNPITFDLADSPQVALAASLSLGPEDAAYCMEFGAATGATPIKDTAAQDGGVGLFKAKGAGPPTDCTPP